MEKEQATECKSDRQDESSVENEDSNNIGKESSTDDVSNNTQNLRNGDRPENIDKEKGSSSKSKSSSNSSLTDKASDYGTSLLQDGIFYDNEIFVRPELIESLTAGFTEKFLPSLEKNKKTVDQIKNSQDILTETVHQENTKFEECQAIEGLSKTMTKAKLYHSKLLKVRKEMTALYEKSAKLKRRALRLQQQKQKEEMTRAQQMEVEYEKEKMLTARVASSSPEKET